MCVCVRVCLAFCTCMETGCAHTCQTGLIFDYERYCRTAECETQSAHHRKDWDVKRKIVKEIDGNKRNKQIASCITHFKKSIKYNNEWLMFFQLLNKMFSILPWPLCLLLSTHRCWKCRCSLSKDAVHQTQHPNGVEKQSTVLLLTSSTHRLTLN